MRRLALSMAAFALIASGQTIAPGQTPPPAKPAESPVPAEEIAVTGSVDVGYTWRSDVGGSFDAYRSIVNLGSGPKLLGTDLTITDPKSRLFDVMHVRAYDW